MLGRNCLHHGTRTWILSTVVRFAVGEVFSSKVGLVDALTGYVVTNVAYFDAMLATEMAVRVAGDSKGSATDAS